MIADLRGEKNRFAAAVLTRFSHATALIFFAGALLTLAGCLPHKPAAEPPGVRLDGFHPTVHFDEQFTTFTLEPEVKVHVNVPGPGRFHRDKPTTLIFYALPNGNTTEQTIGKQLREGVDWHFGIQHIGAQTRRLREAVPERNFVIAYLEAFGKSWPAWKKKYPDFRERIPAIIAEVKLRLGDRPLDVVLSSHSGGGSFVFGYLDAFEEIPDEIARISFLDSNYGYSEESRHGDKLVAWLRRSPSHCLSVIAYDDREIELNGKKIIGPDGGTYRRTGDMLRRLGMDFALTAEEKNEYFQYRALDGRIDIIVLTNPRNQILHTVLVGDMNGFLHAMTTATPRENTAAVFKGPIAYEKWIQPD